MSLKFLQNVCEQNGKATTSRNTIFRNLGEGGRGCCGTNWPTEVVEIATPCEFDENYKFFTAFCDPYMGHTFKLFCCTFHHKKDIKDGF